MSWETLKMFSHNLDTCFCYYSSIKKLLHWIIPWLGYCDNLTHIFRNPSQLLGSFPILFCVLYYQKNKQNKKNTKILQDFLSGGMGDSITTQSLNLTLLSPLFCPRMMIFQLFSISLATLSKKPASPPVGPNYKRLNYAHKLSQSRSPLLQCRDWGK